VTARRWWFLVVVGWLVVSGCAIRPQTSPSDLPAERAGVFGEPQTGDAAAGSNRVYLLAPADPDEPQRLRSVLRDVAPDPAAILGSLFAGPNVAERADQIDTAIPADVALVSARRVGQVLTVDVTDAFDALTPEALRLAVAQIVSTATDIDGIQEVQLRIDGTPRVWPLGNGELTDRPLTAFDYPGLVESTQPDFPGTPAPVS
jgi:spore germination protein GerM